MDQTPKLEEIYITYKSYIYSYFLNQTSNPQVSEELCQEVFLKAFNGFAGFKGKSSIKTWLYRIAHNEYVSWYRKEKNYQWAYIERMEELNVLVEHKSPLDQVMRLEERQRILKVLWQMQEEYRSALILSDLHQLSYNEISNVLEWSLSKVKITIYRGRIKFKQLYEKAGDQ